MEKPLTDRRVLLAGMALGLALFYRSGWLPSMAAGLALFGALALLRPALALLFVPLTAPLYLAPVSIPGIRASGFELPLHEVVLLGVLGATLARAVWDRARGASSPGDLPLPAEAARSRWRYLPHALFLAAGLLGVALAVERAPALRELRWFIVEPLLFYGLLVWQLRREGERYAYMVVGAFVQGGAFVAALGLLQAIGLDLVEVILNAKRDFAENTVEAGGVLRVASVYGNPNNLGLYLGRVWPLAAALALASRSGRTRWLFAAAALLCLGGIVVSYSRGAWLGAGAALLVLALPFARGRLGRRAVPALLGLGLLLAALAGLVLLVRGGVVGGSTSVRLLLWRESIQLIALHPLGLGLDQFYYYHNPEFGRSLIDPALVGTSEQYARHPHNLVLELWLLLGPLGLAAVMWLLARAARMATVIVRSATPGQLPAIALGAAAALVAALVHGLVDTFYFWPDLAFAFWMLLALVQRRQIDGEPDDRKT